MRRIVLLIAVAAVLAVPAALAKGNFPKTVALPAGFQPEGLEIGNGPTFYVGSRATGAVYRGSLRTGKGAVLVAAAPGRAALGIELSRGRLIVAGGQTGKAFVYSAKTGDLIHDYVLAEAPGATFVNDVVATKRAAYFTDSNRDVIYKLPIAADGTLGPPEPIALTGDFELVPGFNLNGIVATPNGRLLIAVQSATGILFTINPGTGKTHIIDVGAPLPNGDGLLLVGRTLYVVRNQNNLVAVVRLSPTLTKGKIVRTLTDPALDVPATIDRFRSRIYAVNARFTTPPTPTTAYQVVRIGK